LGKALYCFADDSKEAIGVVCFEEKEDVLRLYLEAVKSLCKGRKPTDVFEIKNNKVELKASKLSRKGIEFCHLLGGAVLRCAEREGLVEALSDLKVKALIVDEGLYGPEELGKIRKALRAKVKTSRSHFSRGGPHELCGLKVRLSWEPAGVQLADLAARCCASWTS